MGTITAYNVVKYLGTNNDTCTNGIPYNTTKYFVGKKYGTTGFNYFSSPTTAPTSCVSPTTTRRLRDGQQFLIFYY